MKELRDDELDLLVRNWGARQAASEGQLDELARRIAERFDEVAGDGDVVTAPRRTSHRMRRLTMIGGAIAASIAVFVYVIRPFTSSVSPDANDVLLADGGDAELNVSSSIDGLELADKARLARELQFEFPGRFAWLMESSNEMKIGLSEDENTRPSRYIAVRFVIESQGPDDRKWKPIRALDVVTQSEETVQTWLASNHGARIAIWTYATPDGMISVDSELMLSGPVPIRVSSSRLLSSGVPTEIWQSEQGGVKYRVNQAAELLDNEQLG